MSVINPAMLSAEERAVGLRARRDLVIHESVYQGENCWIVKDPLAMKYYRLQHPEYVVLCELKRPCSYQELKVLLNRKFPEKTTRIESVQQLVTQLHQNGLLLSDRPNQSLPLKKRKNKELRQKLIGLMSSLVSLRLPGFDPEWILKRLYPLTRWCFTVWFTTLVLGTCVAAAALLLANLDEFVSRLPDFQSFFAFENLLFMGLILMVTKTIHEFGHGLMCKHFGGECHEIGIMFLVLMPAMYCNTSDSWILPNRWHRMAIGAAGMYVEVFLAAICTFVWWNTNPGWVHYLALNVMFLSSVSTILFNANPLLRYDGYYILSDFLEIPNLSQKSRMALLSKLRVWCLGMKPVNPRLLPQRQQIAFAVYSVASFVYRWVVLVMIFWFLAEVFEPYGLAAVGHVLIAISLAGMTVVPLYKLAKFLIFPGRLREVKRTNWVITTFAATAVVGLIAWFPIPHYAWASFVIEPFEPQRVVVDEPGVLTKVYVRPGESVKKGALLATLENPDAMMAIEKDRGRIAELELQKVEEARTNRWRSNELEQELIKTRSELAERTKKVAKLNLMAQRSGTIFPPKNRVDVPRDLERLKQWSGSPLDRENLHAFMSSGDELCQVADPNHFQVFLLIEQADIGLVQPGQPVTLVLEQFRKHYLRTTIEFVSRDELKQVPRELSQTNGGPIAVTPGASGEEPVLKLYQAKSELFASDLESRGVRLQPGYFGTAKIRIGDSSIGAQLLRYFRTVINFR